MELICISDKYDENYTRVFSKYNIRYPKENDIVELLRVVKYPRLGRVGLIISGYENQFIPGEIMGIKGDVEVSFNKDRFRTLLNLKLTTEMLKEFQDEQKGLLTPLKTKENAESLRNLL